MGYKIKRILVGTQQVRPVWKPGSNTVAYYKFDGNLNDSSGNSRNLSVARGTFTYSSLSSGAKYVQTAFDSYSTQIDSFPFSSVNGTLSFWMSFTNNTKGNGGATSGATPGATILDLSGANGLIRPILSWGASGTWYYGYSVLNIAGSWNNQSSYYPQGTSDSWHYYCTTFSSGTVEIYVDNILFKTGSVATDTSFKFIINTVAGTSTQKTTYSSRDKLSELIFENKVRTADERTNYYNQTKSNYGL